MPSQHKHSRKASWLAFGLVALAAASRAAQGAVNDGGHEAAITDSSITTHPETTASSHPTQKDTAGEFDATAEASRAYKLAMVTLASLTTPEPVSHPSWSSSGSSLLSQLLPNPQGQGPVANIMRIAIKLHNKNWLPRFLSSKGAADGNSKKRQETLRAIKVLDLLHHAADLGHTDALFALAKLSLLPPSHHFNANPKLAYEAFSSHIAKTGNATSQAYVAFFHATGYEDIVPVDQAKAQLYYSFAAHAGDKSAQMVLGYRHWSGIAVTEDCSQAVRFYEAAAEQAMAKFLSGPPGGRTLPHTPTRISDLDGGVYGHGASVASTGLNSIRPAIKAARARRAGETWEYIRDYYMYNADRGETDFLYRLGKIYYHGSLYSSPGGISSGGEGVGRVARDYEHARYYFERIARAIWPMDPLDLQHVPRREETPQAGIGYASVAAAYLGRMHLRGEGVRPDPKRARLWLERGAEYGDKECHNMLGIIWRDGLVDGRKDMRKAISYFTVAAGQELAEAQVNLGKYHYQKGDMKLATTYFESALRHGSPFEAYYYLAQINARSMMSLPQPLRPGACSMAVSFFKVVSERGAWGDDFLQGGELAWERGEVESALLYWSIAAERGQEAAQNNVAYVLDPDKSILNREALDSNVDGQARSALIQWVRSAAQNNVDALVKVGDYYFHGIGVDSTDTERFEKAAVYYQSAADTQVSALAMWNLGWMYEHGVGVPQDFHLAKRHYDAALETNQEAYLPVILSLVRLYARSFWHTLMGGSGGLNLFLPDDDAYGAGYDMEPQQRQELDDGQGGTEAFDEPGLDLGVEDDGHWYMGRARDEFNRRRRGADVFDEDNDPIRWGYDRQREELDRDGDFGPEDYFDASLRGAREEGAGDELFETLVLVALCLVVSLLLYVRGRFVERLRREERQQQQQQQPGQMPGQTQPQRNEQDAGGLFPPEGDPARDEWAIPR